MLPAEIGQVIGKYLLGVILIYAGYKYFKRRKNEEEQPEEPED